MIENAADLLITLHYGFFGLLALGDILGKNGNPHDNIVFIPNRIINIMKYHFVPNIFKIFRLTGLQNLFKMRFPQRAYIFR